MTWHTMVISEPDQHHAGFIRRYYAMVDVSMAGVNWWWQQVDANGQNIGITHGPFAGEGDAQDDAIAKLNGDEWEP